SSWSTTEMTSSISRWEASISPTRSMGRGGEASRSSVIGCELRALEAVCEASAELVDAEGADDQGDDPDADPRDEQGQSEGDGTLPAEERDEHELGVLEHEHDERDQDDGGDAQADPHGSGAGPGSPRRVAGRAGHVCWTTARHGSG